MFSRAAEKREQKAWTAPSIDCILSWCVHLQDPLGVSPVRVVQHEGVPALVLRLLDRGPAGDPHLLEVEPHHLVVELATKVHSKVRNHGEGPY